MDVKSTDLVSLFEQALQNLSHTPVEQSGIVIQVGDGMCTVHGLLNAMYGELVEFEHGNRGIIFNLDDDSVVVFLIYSAIPVMVGEVVTRTGSVFQVPVGDALIGRIVSPVGVPLDALGDLATDTFRPIETPVVSIINRSPVNESLETGILAIDALIPIGKGQRELIIGNRGTGKTAIAVDAILHQRGKNVLCIYVSVGQRQASIARLARLFEENGAMEYTTMVCADSSDAVLNQYLAPYVGCTIGEYFRDQGRDVLIVYDDLSNHAVAFREMSLLMRRAPGREAFPGDVFYLHSRLLERAGKITSGGSLTALPIVQVQGDDITSYIPTNLISITDGQIFLDTRLYNQGIRPAINLELSVSRVGGAAQTKAIKRMTKALRLDLAQYHELLDFAQFGTELDEVSKKNLARGAIAVELLKQAQYATYNFIDQTIMLFLMRENFLDHVPLRDVRTYATQCVSYISSVYPDLYESIAKSQDVAADIEARLHTIVQEFNTLFVPRSIARAIVKDVDID